MVILPFFPKSFDYALDSKNIKYCSLWTDNINPKRQPVI